MWTVSALADEEESYLYLCRQDSFWGEKVVSCKLHHWCQVSIKTTLERPSFKNIIWCEIMIYGWDQLWHLLSIFTLHYTCPYYFIECFTVLYVGLSPLWPGDRGWAEWGSGLNSWHLPLGRPPAPAIQHLVYVKYWHVLVVDIVVLY